MATGSFFILPFSGNEIYDVVCACLLDVHLTLLPTFSQIWSMFRILKTLGSDKFCEKERWSLEEHPEIKGVLVHEPWFTALVDSWAHSLILPKLIHLILGSRSSFLCTPRSLHIIQREKSPLMTYATHFGTKFSGKKNIFFFDYCIKAKAPCSDWSFRMPLICGQHEFVYLRSQPVSSDS